MKIGILTYQNTVNFGAALQCYALYKKCEELGVNPEIIDYENEKITNSLSPLSIVTNRGKNKLTILRALKLIMIYPLAKSKESSFRKFDKNFMKFSKEKYTDKNSIISNPPVYDKYVIGSDQVWNHNINGLDTTYFMDFVKDKEKIFTFASSFGLEEIENSKREVYKNGLGKINKISVREEKGAQLIKELIGTEVEVISDPTFLYLKEEWEEILQLKNLKNNSSHIATYFLNHQTREDFEKSYSQSRYFKEFKRVKLAGGFKIKDFIDKKTSVNYGNGPVEFFKTISGSKYVFTDSFHGTVFSIILNKKFTVFLSGDAGRDSRIINLLKRFGLEDRIFTGDLNKVKQDINFKKVRDNCKMIQSESMNYLLKELRN